MVEQQLIAAFRKIIAPLVDAVNRAFYFGNVVVGRVGNAGLVLGMPQLKVRLMLRNHRIQKCAVALRWKSGLCSCQWGVKRSCFCAISAAEKIIPDENST